MKNISIQDIAAKLNLSRNTVSKALNNDERVSITTKQRVFREAIEMGYKKIDPELIAEIEKEAPVRTRNVAIITRKELSDFWVKIMNGISRELNEHNYNLFYNYITLEDEENNVLPNNIMNRNVDGIIVLNTFKKDYIEKLKSTKLPKVYLDTPVGVNCTELEGDVLLMDSYSGVYEITKHLISQGCKRLGFIGDTNYCRTIYERWLGFEAAMRDSKFEVDKDICFNGSSPTRYYGFDELESILNSVKNMPDGFVCANDAIALFIMKILEEKGYKVPQDISITGFDDTHDAVIVKPRLTTVHVSKGHMGKRLVDELLSRINDPDRIYETVIMSTEVKIRESTRVL